MKFFTAIGGNRAFGAWAGTRGHMQKFDNSFRGLFDEEKLLSSFDVYARNCRSSILHTHGNRILNFFLNACE